MQTISRKSIATDLTNLALVVASLAVLTIVMGDVISGECDELNSG